MFMPVSVDAPLYHRPWCTTVLIVCCLVAFVIHKAAAGDQPDGYLSSFMAIQFGDFRPWQWFTSVLVHPNSLELIHNVLFLWIFGMVVEGKVGWWKFLIVCATIIALMGLWLSILMLGSVGFSEGASGLVMGLMMIALLWAPENEVEVVLLHWAGARHFDHWPITGLGMLSMMVQVVNLTLSGFELSFALTILLGAGAGTLVGVNMLKRKWVDCEGWDLFSLIERRRVGRARTEEQKIFNERQTTVYIRRPKGPEDPGVIAARTAVAKSVAVLLDAGRVDSAFAAYQGNQGERLPLERGVRARLVRELVALGQVEDARGFADRALAEAPDDARLRLIIAGWRVEERRPIAALDLLTIIDDDLDAEGRTRRDRLRAEAEAMQTAGVLEIDHEGSR